MSEPRPIGRLWCGRALPDQAHLYEEHLRVATLPELKRLAGFERAYVLSRPEENDVEFVILSLWMSEDAIRSFAGVDVEAAVVPLAAQRMLSAYDERARHYHVVFAATPP